MKNDIVDKKSVLIFFNRSSSRTYLASKEYILMNFKGFKISEYNDGFIIE